MLSWWCGRSGSFLLLVTYGHYWKDDEGNDDDDAAGVHGATLSRKPLTPKPPKP